MVEKKDLENIDEHEPRGRSPLVYIFALFLLLLMVLSIFPYYAVREDPYPKSIPTINDVAPDLQNIMINKTYNRNDYYGALNPNDPFIKQVSTRIATFGCDSNKLCQAKAEYYFVRDNFIYVSEYDNYIQSPTEMLSTRGGDCDDNSILLANLLMSIGIPVDFVFKPRHVYIKAYIKDAPRKYTKDGWIELDPTCKDCEFGEIPRKYIDT